MWSFNWVAYARIRQKQARKLELYWREGFRDPLNSLSVVLYGQLHSALTYKDSSLISARKVLNPMVHAENSAILKPWIGGSLALLCKAEFACTLFNPTIQQPPMPPSSPQAIRFKLHISSFNEITMPVRSTLFTGFRCIPTGFSSTALRALRGDLLADKVLQWLEVGHVSR
jgi:hypothetical protein